MFLGILHRMKVNLILQAKVVHQDTFKRLVMTYIEQFVEKIIELTTSFQ